MHRRRGGALHNGAALGGCRTEHTSERNILRPRAKLREVDGRAIAKWGRQGEEETAEEEKETKTNKKSKKKGKKKGKEKKKGK